LKQVLELSKASEAGLLNKSSSLAATLGVVKFKAIFIMT